MRINLMIEGQEDVTWHQWVALARSAEEAGLEGLFRSDHYLSVIGQSGRGSLDAWATLAALARSTDRIRLGTMVSPATFRHPSVLAKTVVTVDHVSAGRAELGIGAGWLEAEHRAYGFPFPPTPVRLELLDEQIEVVHRSWSEGRFDFRGRHYRVEGLDAQPKPVQRPHPNLIVGGSGGARSVATAARWADEYNTVSPTLDDCRQRRAAVVEAWRAADRDPATLVFSVMTGCVVGVDDDDLRRRARAVMARLGDTGPDDDWLDRHRDGWVVGSLDQVADRIRALEDAGVQRVMLQHLAHDDLTMVGLLGEIARRCPS